MKKCRIRDCKALAAPNKPEEPDMAGLCKAHQASQADRWEQNGVMKKSFDDIWKGHEAGLAQWQDAVGKMPYGGPFDHREMAEAVVDDLLGDDDVASVAQSAMNTPYAVAAEAYRHSYSIYKSGPKAWNHALYELGIWAPGESNQYRVQQLGYDLTRFLKEFKKEWKPQDIDAYMQYWLEERVRAVVDNESQVQGICQLWRKMATS